MASRKVTEGKKYGLNENIKQLEAKQIAGRSSVSDKISLNLMKTDREKLELQSEVSLEAARTIPKLLSGDKGTNISSYGEE